MRKILLLLILFGFAAGQASYAQVQRQLPANGKRGVTGDPQPMPLVAIGRESLTLAPGGIIFDRDNRTIVHGSLPSRAQVLYQLTTTGQIQRIYILRPEEQVRIDQARK